MITQYTLFCNDKQVGVFTDEFVADFTYNELVKADRYASCYLVKTTQQTIKRWALGEPVANDTPGGPILKD